MLDHPLVITKYSKMLEDTTRVFDHHVRKVHFTTIISMVISRRGNHTNTYLQYSCWFSINVRGTASIPDAPAAPRGTAAADGEAGCASAPADVYLKGNKSYHESW